MEKFNEVTWRSLGKIMSTAPGILIIVLMPPLMYDGSQIIPNANLTAPFYCD